MEGVSDIHVVETFVRDWMRRSCDGVVAQSDQERQEQEPVARFQLHSLGFPVIRFELPADLPLNVAVEEYSNICKRLHPEVFGKTTLRGQLPAVVYQIGAGEAARDGVPVPWFHPQLVEPLEMYMEEGMRAAMPPGEFARDVAGHGLYRKIHELETHVDVTFALYEELTALVLSGERGGVYGDAGPEAELDPFSLTGLVYGALGPSMGNLPSAPDGNPARSMPIDEVRRLVLERQHATFAAQDVPRPAWARAAVEPQRAVSHNGARAALLAAGQLVTSHDATAAYLRSEPARGDDDQAMAATNGGKSDIEIEMETQLKSYFGPRVKLFDTRQTMADLGLADEKLEITLQVNLFP